MTNAKTKAIDLWLRMQSQKLGGLGALASAIAMPYSTFHNRLKDPSKFNVEEIRAIITALKLTEEERQAMYRLLFQ